MAAWPTGAGERLPLEAFVHRPGAPAGARTFQRDYLLTHKRYLPVLEVIANPADGQVFIYDPAEQSVP